MSRTSTVAERHVCANCQTVHAGTAVQVAPGDFEFDPPNSCGACGATEFIWLQNWELKSK